MVQLTEEQLGTVHQQAFQEPFPREQFLRYLQSGAPTYLIEQNGKRIGYYSYLIGPDAKMHISALVIEPTYQSDGVGSQVMARLEDEAHKAGVQVMEVFVQGSNERSMAFTRKLGFVEVFRVDPNTTCFQKRITALPGQPGQPQPGGPPAQPGYGQPGYGPPGFQPPAGGFPPAPGMQGPPQQGPAVQPAGPPQQPAMQPPGYGPQPGMQPPGYGPQPGMQPPGPQQTGPVQSGSSQSGDQPMGWFG